MKLRNVRWWVCGMLFLATVISYVDRQTMSVAAPVIAREYSLTNEQVARILSSFILAYAFGQLVAGRFLDWTGSRVGFAISIVWWSLANLLTATVTRPWGFSFYRLLLGIGESGNFPGGAKVVTEWFPPQERALAGGLFTSGASVGAVIAAPMIATIIHYWGWRAAFVLTGSLGFVWVAAWLLFYNSPQKHALLTAHERAWIEHSPDKRGSEWPLRWIDLFRFRQVWALTLARFLEESLIWLCVFWLPKYMVEVRGLSLLATGWTLTIPFIALDLGYVFGGWISSRLMRRGWRSQNSKLFVMSVAAALMLGTVPASFAGSVGVAVLFLSMAMMGHGAWFSNVLTMPGEVVPASRVASVYGISALGGGLGGIVFTELTGIVADRFHSFTPVLVAAGILPLLATALLKWLGGSMAPLVAAQHDEAIPTNASGEGRS